MNSMTAPPRAGALLAQRVRLPAGLGATALARGQARRAIRAWSLPVDQNDALLLTSELVANAVRHVPGGAVTLSIRGTAGWLRYTCTTHHGACRPPRGD
jgi:anti-sigma regulatory factor (Ser/Thr protein kinase)